MSERLRVGVIGCGVMGAFHVRNYLQLECAHLVAVADPSAESRRQALGEIAGRRVPGLARPDRVRLPGARRGLDRLPLRAARDGGAGGARRRPPRSRREADRDQPPGRAAHARRSDRGRPQADGRPCRALQPGDREAAQPGRRGTPGADLPRPRDPGRAAAVADPGHRRGDRPRHPRPRRDAARARPLDRRDLRRRRPLHAQLPGGPAHLPRALQRRRLARSPGRWVCSTSTG